MCSQVNCVTFFYFFTFPWNLYLFPSVNRFSTYWFSIAYLFVSLGCYFDVSPLSPASVSVYGRSWWVKFSDAPSFMYFLCSSLETIILRYALWCNVLMNLLLLPSVSLSRNSSFLPVFLSVYLASRLLWFPSVSLCVCLCVHGRVATPSCSWAPAAGTPACHHLTSCCRMSTPSFPPSLPRIVLSTPAAANALRSTSALSFVPCDYLCANVVSPCAPDSPSPASVLAQLMSHLPTCSLSAVIPTHKRIFLSTDSKCLHLWFIIVSSLHPTEPFKSTILLNREMTTEDNTQLTKTHPPTHTHTHTHILTHTDTHTQTHRCIDKGPLKWNLSSWSEECVAATTPRDHLNRRDRSCSGVQSCDIPFFTSLHTPTHTALSAPFTWHWAHLSSIAFNARLLYPGKSTVTLSKFYSSKSTCVKMYLR